MSSICQIEKINAGGAYPRSCPTCGISGKCVKGLPHPFKKPDPMSSNTTPAPAVQANLWRKKPVVIQATQWFKHGDHPDDYAEDQQGLENGELRTFTGAERKANGWEGGVVRYYRHPDVPSESLCEQCGKPHHIHGWIDTLEQGHRVCPDDWIITGVKGEHYPCKPDIFAATYEAAALSVQPATPPAVQAYGCHCDLEPGMQPDGCVIDAGRPEDCVKSHRGGIKRKEDCPEWRPIAVVGLSVQPVPDAPADAWVSVSDGLPGDDRLLVAVHTPGNILAEVWPAQWSVEYQNFEAGGGWFEPDEIAHWTALPPLPARGIDSPEGVETQGSTAQPQEPGGEATRPDESSAEQTAQLPQAEPSDAELRAACVELVRFYREHNGVLTAHVEQLETVLKQQERR